MKVFVFKWIYVKKNLNFQSIMSEKISITKVIAREILDSRGHPTIEVEVFSDNFMGRASVPSGASTGTREAVELRDLDDNRYGGKGVLKAVKKVNTIISKNLVGLDPRNQDLVDQKLIELDGTDNKSNLGANAILGTSIACARLGSYIEQTPLYKYLNKNSAVIPTPFINLLNGGVHAPGGADFQEIMVVPYGFNSLSEALRAGAEINSWLKHLLKRKQFATTVGDEGGFAPKTKSNEESISLLLESIRLAGYSPTKEVGIALDVAASSFYKANKYVLESEDRILSSEEMIEYYQKLVKKYPIISIEDPLDEDDWAGWTLLYKTLRNKIQIVGDDLTVTNPAITKKAIEHQAINTVLIKPNQIGTLSETIETINICKENNLHFMVSHRSGETVDTFLADFSVAMGGGQIKTGAVVRGERTGKYNQLLRIEEEIKAANPRKTVFSGQKSLSFR